MHEPFATYTPKYTVWSTKLFLKKLVFIFTSALRRVRCDKM